METYNLNEDLQMRLILNTSKDPRSDTMVKISYETLARYIEMEDIDMEDIDINERTHPDIMKLVRRFPDRSWDWLGISENEYVTLDFIEEYIDENWRWRSNYNASHGLSGNPNITPEFIEKYIDKDWCWHSLSGNPNLTLEFIEKHIDKKWRWGKDDFYHGDYSLSCNPIITRDFLERHLDKPWYFGYYNDIFYNKITSVGELLTIEFIDRHYQHFLKLAQANSSFKGLLLHILKTKKRIFRPLLKDSFKKELADSLDERRYRPEQSGYVKCKEEFDSLKE